MPSRLKSFNYTIDQIPKGKYIICAQKIQEAKQSNDEFEDNSDEENDDDEFQCIEVIIEKYSGHSKNIKQKYFA